MIDGVASCRLRRPMPRGGTDPWFTAGFGDLGDHRLGSDLKVQCVSAVYDEREIWHC